MDDQKQNFVGRISDTAEVQQQRELKQLDDIVPEAHEPNVVREEEWLENELRIAMMGADDGTAAQATALGASHHVTSTQDDSCSQESPWISQSRTVVDLLDMMT